MPRTEAWGTPTQTYGGGGEQEEVRREAGEGSFCGSEGQVREGVSGSGKSLESSSRIGSQCPFNL